MEIGRAGKAFLKMARSRSVRHRPWEEEKKKKNREKLGNSDKQKIIYININPTEIQDTVHAFLN